jgi:hypothetical protein
MIIVAAPDLNDKLADKPPDGVSLRRYEARAAS